MNHKCANCGSHSMRVRHSESVGMLVIEAIWVCNSCSTKHHIYSEIVTVQTPTYHERPEVKRINKPLLQSDTNTKDLFEASPIDEDT